MGDDERVAPLHPFQQDAQFSVASLPAAAGHFRHPLVYRPISTIGVTPYLLLLVGQELLARADS